MSPDASLPRPSDWSAVLDELERIADGPQLGVGWAPPEGLGAMPPELAARAQRIAAAQDRAIRRLSDEQRHVAGHLAAVAAVAPVPHRAAVYLDVVA